MIKSPIRNNNRITCLIAITLAFFSLATQIHADEAKATKLFMSGNYQSAKKHWETLFKASPTPETAIGLARTLNTIGQYQDALKTLKSVETTGKAKAEWNIIYAETLSQIGQYREALEKASTALELSPVSATAILTKGMLEELFGKKKEAIKTYKTMQDIVAANSYQKDAKALVALGQIMDRYAILIKRRASEQAPNILHNYFQEAYLKVDSKYWPAHIAAAEFLFSKHKTHGAMEELALAKKINKKLPDAHALKAALLLNRWSFESCLKEVDLALKINPKHAYALYQKAACLMQWRRFKDVPKALDKILAFNPNNIEALSLMAAAYIRLNNKKKAEEFANRVKAISPNSSILPQTIGQWLVSGRKYKDAEPYLLKAVQLSPEQAGPLASLGRLYMETGEEKNALIYLVKARKLDDFRGDVTHYLNIVRSLGEFEVLETPHFIFKADKADKVMLKIAAEYMESIYKAVTSDYGWEPEKKTIIEILPSQKDFSARISGRGWIPTVGACTGRVIAIATPNTERGALGMHNWTEVLRHEFAHTVTLGMTDNTIPHWFTEACAVWQQKDKHAYNHILKLVSATQYNQLFPVSKINWGFIRPKRQGDRHLAYAQSEWMLRYIIITHGFEKTREMLQGFAKGYDQTRVFKEILKIEEKQFDKDFLKWAKKTVKQWGFDPDAPPKVSVTSKEIIKSPDNPTVLANHAKALYFARKHSESKSYAEKAIKIDSTNTIALRLLARIYLAKAQKESKITFYNMAIDMCRRLEESDPTTSTSPDVLATCYQKMGLLKKQPDQYIAQAIVALELLQKRAPLNSRSYTELASLYMTMGWPERALPNLIHLHRHSTNNQKFARQIAEIYRTMDNLNMAKKYFNEVIYTNPFEINAHEAITSILLKQEKFKDAIDAANQITLIDPKSPKPHSFLAKILYKAGKSTKSKELLTKALAEIDLAVELGAPPVTIKRTQRYIKSALKRLK